MIAALRRMLAGLARCPACGGRLYAHEAGYRICDCGVVVDFAQQGWRYAGEWVMRPLHARHYLP